MIAILLSLYGLLVTLNLLDGFSTWKVLQPDKLQRERNPLARKLFNALGIPRGIIVAELLWIGFITAVFFLLWKHPSLDLALLILLCLGVAIFAWIVTGNFRSWRRLRRRDNLMASRKPKGGNDA
jgi:hypothetical protein